MTSLVEQLDKSVDIARIEAFPLQAQVSDVPRSSLGAMAARNGLLVRIEDRDGAFGWGEIWCNFPPYANRSRQQLLETVIAPGLVGNRFERFDEVREQLESTWARMALHVGEPGPFNHCFAGIDGALWDLVARREKRPLCALLGAERPQRVRVYASTLNAARAPDLARELQASGHRAFKLKVGLDPEADGRLVRGVREAIGEDPDIFIDANQNWSLEQAFVAIDRLSDAGIALVEEPISAAAPLNEWKALADGSSVPLAAGENIASLAAYEAHLANGALGYYQPDVAKWGGVSGCLDVGRKVRAAGFVYCPHYMGTAVGLAASLHLLAAVGGDGLVELDSNSNPLRTDLCALDLSVSEGCVRVPDGHGIGVIPDADALKRYQA